MLVFHQRAARRKARAAAVAEALALLGDLEASAPAGGPLSERCGVFWIELPDRHLAAATARLPRLGYTTAVDRLVPAAGPADVRWRRRPWRLLRLWTEDAAGHREQAPDRRVFLFETGGGPARPQLRPGRLRTTHPIRSGQEGGGGVADARLPRRSRRLLGRRHPAMARTARPRDGRCLPPPRPTPRLGGTRHGAAPAGAPT